MSQRNDRVIHFLALFTNVFAQGVHTSAYVEVQDSLTRVVVEDTSGSPRLDDGGELGPNFDLEGL